MKVVEFSELVKISRGPSVLRHFKCPHCGYDMVESDPEKKTKVCPSCGKLVTIAKCCLKDIRTILDVELEDEIRGCPFPR